MAGLRGAKSALIRSFKHWRCRAHLAGIALRGQYLWQVFALKMPRMIGWRLIGAWLSRVLRSVALNTMGF